MKSRLLTALNEMGVLIPSGDVITSGDIRWQAVFFMGPAGAGKSFVRDKKYMQHAGFKLIDPDEIKKLHPDYDPERPFKVHQWSKDVSDSQFNKVVSSGNGDPVVVDGTGRDAKSLAKKVAMAEKNGYRTFLVYVWVPLSISLFRNRNRPRFVPEAVILDKYPLIDKGFKFLKGKVDKFKVIPNFSAGEQKEAEADLKMYPAPQEVRPPRPGDADYGADATQVASDLDVARSLVKMAKLIVSYAAVEKALGDDYDVSKKYSGKSSMMFDYKGRLDQSSQIVDDVERKLDRAGIDYVEISAKTGRNPWGFEGWFVEVEI